jgi:cytochrome c oxidase assembly protein subunit 15
MMGRPAPKGAVVQPSPFRTAMLGATRSRSTAAWLFAVALLILSMVVVGGATRLTGSGLSITQWKPVSGALPPLSKRAWSEEFAHYRDTPQYRLVNRGMTLAQFQAIFWWEWAHRLLGRLVGAAFAIPFVVLWLTGRLPRRLMGRCAALFSLGALQGVVGWWMVQSGLETRISVAPERLAIHLGLALLLFVALIWTGLEAWAGPAPGLGRRDGWTRVSPVLAAAVFLQCLLGALVAGNKAGLIDNDWPLMGGSVFPTAYWQGGVWATLVHDPSAVQFNHRLAAYGVFGLAITIALAGLRSKSTPGGLRGLSALAGVMAVIQVALGIATLINDVPLSLALMHQLMAVLLLAAAVGLTWRSRRL